MTPRVIIYGLILAIFIVGIFLKQRLGQPPHKVDLIQAPVQHTNQTVTKMTAVNHAVSDVPPVVRSRSYTSPPEATNAAVARFVDRFVDSKNAPINFYGQFIDQNSNPVPGVKIIVAVEQVSAHNPALMELDSKYIDIEKTADDEGRFDILGQTGCGLGVESIQKAGYKTSPNAANHFGPGNGSYYSPSIIKLWKNGEKAQLVEGSEFWGIVPDGRTYTIDLLQGTKVESANATGDLRLSVTRPPGVSRGDRYDWSFQITPLGGGITEVNDEFMYEAPENGYSPQFDFHVMATDPQWTYHPRFNFYVTARGGRVYGRISTEIFAHYQDSGLLRIDYAVNPNGSPNLQP
jgi:hypothetical protein